MTRHHHLPLRLMFTDEPMPAGTAMCLTCGWQAAQQDDPWGLAETHRDETGHPTVAPPLPDGQWRER